MVTLITEQLRKQSLEELAYRRAFSLNVSVPEVGASPSLCWSSYGLTPESSWQLCSQPSLQDALRSSSALDPLIPSLPEDDPLRRLLLLPSTSATDLSFRGAPPPPPPPPKRHCRSLSVPEDLWHCRSAWRPSASKIWTPVKRRCQSGGGDSLPLRGPSSSLHSSSSPTFFSLALAAESPPPRSLPWEAGPRGRAFLPSPSSCSSSPSPLCPSRPPQRRFSLSPALSHCPRAAPAASSPHSPCSACSTPSASRRAPPPPLPRCHSQPCDLRKPGLKRRHDPDTLPYCARPGLDFSKMTQIRNGDPFSSGAGVSFSWEPVLGDFRGSFSPAEGLGRTSIGPLSESEEEEEEEEERKGDAEGGNIFERDCTELDLNLIEEN